MTNRFHLSTLSFYILEYIRGIRFGWLRDLALVLISLFVLITVVTEVIIIL